jgi:DNA-binding CsgD family transcriptional regulator
MRERKSTRVDGRLESRARAALGPLDRGRRHYERRAWAAAFDDLTLSDSLAPLPAADLERLATAAHLAGREADYLRALERAHHAHLQAQAWTRAARSGFWIGLWQLLHGATGPATGWLGRAERLVDRVDEPCVEAGYLLLPTAERRLGRSEAAAAGEAAAAAAAIGERFRDPDLVACARHVQGRALLQQGAVEPGLALLDEAMVSVVGGELGPIMTGLVYCSVIDSCMQVYAFGRARQWTAALSAWCEAQPQLVAFTGTCLVHRAEILELQGAWPAALEEAQRACLRFPAGQDGAAAAFYRQGELHRLRGEQRAAEKAFREASRRGLSPQPGLALLRLAQGKVAAAAVALDSALEGRVDRPARLRLLPARLEVALAAGDLAAAANACSELQDLASALESGVIGALAAQGLGSLRLAEHEPAAALGPLRLALAAWRRAEAPYAIARTRELIGLACRALGDEEGALLELEAARAELAALGALPDAQRIAAGLRAPAEHRAHGLSRRELQVLQLVAAGKSNKAIAAELRLSPRTIDRHVSNLFRKLAVTSRTAAATYAYQQGLV